MRLRTELPVMPALRRHMKATNQFLEYRNGIMKSTEVLNYQLLKFQDTSPLVTPKPCAKHSADLGEYGDTLGIAILDKLWAVSAQAFNETFSPEFRGKTFRMKASRMEIKGEAGWWAWKTVVFTWFAGCGLRRNLPVKCRHEIPAARFAADVSFCGKLLVGSINHVAAC